MKTILGLDLGTNSIGWALINQDFENKSGKILGMGSRIIPMGTDKQDYEKGIGITKNADRRIKRTIRKMNKRYKLRRNKLLFILHELGMLPEQFQFTNGIPEATKIQDLELLPIKKGILQLDSLQHYQLKVRALSEPIAAKEFGKLLYSFNQLRGYSGGNSDEENTKEKKEDNNDDENEGIKKYEVSTHKAFIQKVEQSESKFQGRGKNKGQEFNKFNVTILLEDEGLEGETELQNLSEKIDQEEELEIRIRRNKKGETTSVVFALPSKTNWRKQMEKTEEDLKQGNLHISQLIIKDLQQNKWTKIRNRVFLRNRYQAEFDAIWDTQSKVHSVLDNCPKEKIEKIANYLFPGKSESQDKLRQEAIIGGLKYIIKEQVIYYQRPLKPQKELISKCQFEKEEAVLANSHPLFQEFRCWKQINNLYITSKAEVYNERKKKFVFQYTDRFLTNEQKQQIYAKLQIQKQVGFNDVKKIVGLKDDKTEYLNGLNVKAKLIGCDTQIEIKKKLGEYFETLCVIDKRIVEKIWKAIFDNSNNGSEYDPKSPKVSSIKEIVKPLGNDDLATELALKFAQTVKFPRKYSSFSEKAILNILPLMQLNPKIVANEIIAKFEAVKNGIERLNGNETVDVETGEVIHDLEDYVIGYIQNNANILETGGFMEAFAVSLVYGKHTAEKISALFKDYHEIQRVDRNLRNPIVEQLANETMQVVKAIWKQYKFNPEDLEIRVELARDLKNSAKERDKISKGQDKNRKVNERIKQRLMELKQEITPKNVEMYKLWSTQNNKDYPAPKKATEPTKDEIEKLRLWEEQGCISPYTLKPIPLSKLFSPERLYDIDHIIPKSRYFDDSTSNKVVCETNINEEKSNRTAWEYISQQSSAFQIASVQDYLSHTSRIFYGRKKKNLLLEKIPSNPVERQIKDTQYISLAVKNELAKIVGSDNVKTSTGEVTDFLRSRWGLKKLFMELTENRFKQMELWDWNKETNESNSEWIKKYFDKEKGKHIYEIKNWSKRYDHRHHAIDALVVALTQQSHIQRLNNLNKYLQDELTKRKEEFKIEVKEDETILEAFFNLEKHRREEVQKQIESSRYFEKPFVDLIEQTKALLEAMVVSIKPKDKLGIKKDNKGNIQLKIKGALHQETNYGKTKDPKTGLLRDTKTIDLSKIAGKDISQIIDEVIKSEIDSHRRKYDSLNEAFTGEGLKAFNENRFQSNKISITKLSKNNISKIVNSELRDFLSKLFENHSVNNLLNDAGLTEFKNRFPKRRKISIYDDATLKPPVYKLKVWYTNKQTEESSLQRLYDDNDKLSVVTGDNYLFMVMEKAGNRIFDIASLYDSSDIAKRSLREKDENFRQRICEDYRVKHKEKPEKFLFSLQQNDLVYLPENVDDPILKFNNYQFKDWLNDTENKRLFSKRVYKVAKFTGKDCHFVPHNYANIISVTKDLTEKDKEELKKKYEGKKSIPKSEINFVEYGSYRDCSPYESGELFIRSLNEGVKGKNKQFKPQKIQDTCVKLNLDWLGNIRFA
ncbi:type II CRISPR RNA-guided endonuclease Cas9 [Lacihabitans sp. LS3-19]|uniref:type II CRISPR RNA-guided endonuclease Cas9 n=1 Tax=Lacihabitans sp. LS3-19 TaxID=2487335 RepID=UPI0020CBA23A|nr:type II CRISPR RNA-guided endonuclease Cas9 [Lacihabitans sp. LS3-19]MCP9767413.1 type II CRISPR RNA-guided endonuclease Cas9 [Lacihabitans sp. LS3-19]